MVKGFYLILKICFRKLLKIKLCSKLLSGIVIQKKERERYQRYGGNKTLYKNAQRATDWFPNLQPIN